MYFEDPHTRQCPRPRSPSHVVLPIELQSIEDETRARALQLRERSPDEIGKITRYRSVVSSAWDPVEMRVPTVALWNFQAARHNTDAVSHAGILCFHCDDGRALRRSYDLIDAIEAEYTLIQQRPDPAIWWR